jgi:hypothetical protein
VLVAGARGTAVAVASVVIVHPRPSERRDATMLARLLDGGQRCGWGAGASEDGGRAAEPRRARVYHAPSETDPRPERVIPAVILTVPDGPA